MPKIRRNKNPVSDNYVEPAKRTKADWQKQKDATALYRRLKKRMGTVFGDKGQPPGVMLQEIEEYGGEAITLERYDSPAAPRGTFYFVVDHDDTRESDETVEYAGTDEIAAMEVFEHLTDRAQDNEENPPHMRIPILPENPGPEQKKKWISYVINTMGINFHPDTPARDYIDARGKRLFTAAQAKLFDEQLDKLSGGTGDEYEIGTGILQERFNSAETQREKMGKHYTSVACRKCGRMVPKGFGWYCGPCKQERDFGNPPDKARLDRLVDATENAYMRFEYTNPTWRAGIKFLVSLGWNDEAIVETMKSKVPRWIDDGECGGGPESVTSKYFIKRLEHFIPTIKEFLAKDLGIDVIKPRVNPPEGEAISEHGIILCPACHGPAYFMGMLGHIEHFRCRNCGMDCTDEPTATATRHGKPENNPPEDEGPHFILKAKGQSGSDRKYNVELFRAKYQSGLSLKDGVLQKIKVSDPLNGWILQIMGTPGRYYLSTLLGMGEYSSHPGEPLGDTLCVDSGQNWNIHGMKAILKEAQTIAMRENPPDMDPMKSTFYKNNKTRYMIIVNTMLPLGGGAKGYSWQVIDQDDNIAEGDHFYRSEQDALQSAKKYLKMPSGWYEESENPPFSQSIGEP